MSVISQTVRARALRQADNPAEASMWSALRNRQLGGYKFVRQLPIDRYFVDFACRERKLIVEIDGSQHVDSAYDSKRDAFLRENGYCVARFWSSHVFKDRDGVCDTILAILRGEIASEILELDFRLVMARKTPHPARSAPPSPQGEK